MKTPRVAVLHGLFTLETSISVPRIYASFRDAAAAQFPVEELPPDFHQRGDCGRRAALAELLARCDAAILPGVISRRHLLEVFAARPSPSFPFLYVPMGELPRGGPLFRNAFPHFGPRDTIAVACRADARIVERLAGSCRARVRVLPFGVDTDRFRPLAPAERARVRAELGYGPRDVVLLYTGRVCSEKNVHGLVELFQELAARHPRLHLCVVGPRRDDPFREFATGPRRIGKLLDDQVRRSPASAARVRFLPQVEPERLAALYGAADLFVNLTLNHDENFGYSAVEAMSCGLPAVVTHWGGQQDTVADGRTGYHVAARLTATGYRCDLWEASRACEALIRSAAARRRMGEAARARVLRLYARERFQKNLGDAVCESVGRGIHAGGANRLSPLGRAFRRAFSRPCTPEERALVKGGRIETWPVYTEHYDLYRELIAPYGSGDARAPRADDDVVFLRSPFIRVTRRQIDVDDPLWPFTCSIEEPITAAVMAELSRRRFTTVGELRARLSVLESALTAELRDLAEIGVIGCSLRT